MIPKPKRTWSKPLPISERPVVIDEPYASNFVLAFRMGYTNILPTKPEKKRIFLQKRR